MNNSELITNNKLARKPGELVFAGLLFGLSIAITYLAFDISGLSSTSSPGTIPVLAAVVLLISSLITLIKTAKKSTNSEPFSFLGTVSTRLFLFFALISFIYILLINQLGFLTASLMYLFVSSLVLYRRGPLLAILISINTLAIIYVVFRALFSVILPEANLWQ